MLIKFKLLIANVIMTFVPILLSAIVIIVIGEVYIKGIESNQGINLNGNVFEDLSVKTSPNYVDINRLSSMDINNSDDFKYLANLDNNLEKSDKGIIIRKDNNIIYESKFLKSTDISKQLGAYGSFEETIPRHGFNTKQAFLIKQKDVVFSDNIKGSIFVVMDARSITKNFKYFILGCIAIIVILVIGINGIVTIFVTKSIVKPLNMLRNATNKITNENLEFQLKYDSKDEIGQLCGDFEKMRIRLKNSIELQKQYENNRNELISNISHDLKTPITSIKGFIEGILDGVASSSEKKERYLKAAYYKVNTVDNLIDELFLYSKLEVNGVSFEFDNVNLVEYLKDCFEELQLDTEEKGIKLNLNIDEGCNPFVLADRDKIRRVIINIVENSMKYIKKEQGNITIKLEENKDYAIVSIIDNGEGIANDNLTYIFERFYRTDVSRNSSTGGSGLGLAISKKIIEGNGGTIWAESILGQGTTICFTLKKV